MRKFFQEYFDFTRSERNGTFVLLAIIAFFFLIPYSFPYLLRPNAVDFSNFDEIIANMEAAENQKKNNHVYKRQIETFPFNPNKSTKDEFIRLGLSSKIAQTILNYRSKGGKFFNKEDFKKIYGIQDEDYARLAPFIFLERTTVSNKSGKTKTSIAPPPPKPIERFPFDPNTVTKSELERLGLSDKVVNTVLKFRARGRFRYTADFAKIYGVSEEQYEELKPYIQIAKKDDKNPIKSFPSAKEKIALKDSINKASKIYEPISVSVNEADQEGWQKIRGIGPYYAKKIIWYRDRLGGFQQLNQIAEVEDLPDSVFQKILPQLILGDSLNLNKININTATTKEINRHPYINWKQAETMVNYRQQHDAYKNIEDVKKILSFKEDFILKIEPYLSY